MGPLKYYGYTINDNGALRTYGQRPEDYETDVLASRAVASINAAHAAAEPFFLWVSPLAPHTYPFLNPPRAAPRPSTHSTGSHFRDRPTSTRSMSRTADLREDGASCDADRRERDARPLRGARRVAPSRR